MNKLQNIYNNLSTQGKWATYAVIITLINILITFFIFPSKYSVIALIFNILIGIVFIYQINCLNVGGCKKYSIYLILIYGFVQVSNLILILLYVFAKGNHPYPLAVQEFKLHISKKK